MKLAWILFIGVALLAGTAQAELTVNSLSYSYSQNFNTLSNNPPANPTGSGTWVDDSTLAGWWWDCSNTTREPENQGYYVDEGSGVFAGGHAYGTAAGDSDRAMGILGIARTGLSYMGVQLKNNTGSAISLADITISYTGEQWRKSTSHGTNEFAYVLSGTKIPVNGAKDNLLSWVNRDALDFVAPQFDGVAGALNGNDPANKTTFTNVQLNTSGTWNNGEYLFLRWGRESSPSPGLAVDDFSINIIPEPASIGLLALSAIGLRMFRRRRLV